MANSEETFQDLMQELERQKKTPVKRKNSKRKGNKGELELCKILQKQFGKTFKRVPQSGAHVGGSNYDKTLRQDAIEILASDLICPSEFRFSIEHKNYNKDAVQISHLLTDKEHDIHRWWKQCKEDAARAQKEPMLIVKLDRAERFCVLRWKAQKLHHINTLIWNDGNELLMITNLKTLLNEEDENFWGLPAA